VADGFKEVADEPRMEEFNKAYDYAVAAGVFEFKHVHFETYQTIREMIKCAGDLAASPLIKPQFVSSAEVFALAINYQTQQAKLIALSID